MIHKIILSNGQVLRLYEDYNSLHIASEEDGDLGYYICKIESDGVLVMPNSGFACSDVVQGLSRKQ